MSKTKIEWCDTTWNPITGCTPISDGCKNCYAKKMATRLRGRCGYDATEPFRITVHEDKFNEPKKWKKPQRIFVCSMGDLFHPDVPIEAIARVHFVIKNNPQHIFIILTKRPDLAWKFYFWNYKYDTCELISNNMIFGVSIENQEQANKRLPVLLSLPIAKKFVSCEPLLGAIDLKFASGIGPNSLKLDWIICGGESGHSARPVNPNWVQLLILQSEIFEIPFFFKGWGEWIPTSMPLTSDQIKALPSTLEFNEKKSFDKDGLTAYKVGKIYSGDKYNGTQYHEFPK